MSAFLDQFGWLGLLGAALCMGLGGFAKGVVGFALPLIAVGTMGSFLPYETAVGLLIVPVLLSNLMQSTRNGIAEAWASLRQFWRLNVVLMVTIAAAAQLVVILPEPVLFGILGATITVFAVIQLRGWQPRVPAARVGAAETGTGLIAGGLGGLSGIWGPPVVLYLLARDVPKVEMIRVQSVSFLLGAMMLTGAHLHSGVLNAATLPVSVLLVVPTIAAMVLGYKVQDRLDQGMFRTITLAVLLLAGLNLLRRALW